MEGPDQMKQDRKYIVYLAVAILIYLAIKLIAPREFNWRITFHPEDKNPYGAYALGQLMATLFPESNVVTANYTLYEWCDTLKTPANLISFSTTFNAGDEDVISLLNNVAKGGSAFISAQYFTGLLADTLHLSTSDYFFETDTYGFLNRSDSSTLSFVNPAMATSASFRFTRKNIHNYFSAYDSSRTRWVAENDLHLPVLIKLPWGEGTLYLNSTPLAFTNFYFLQEDNHEFVSRALSHLPVQPTYWTSYYQLGRLEAQTPLRFILSNEALRWAYYLTLTGIFLFMIFEAKRKQRVIPIVKPLANTSLEFVQTVGNLYFQSGDHRNLADKRIAFFVEQVRGKHGVNLHGFPAEIIPLTAHKTGNTEDSVRELFTVVAHVQTRSRITADELLQLSKKLDSFTY
jgi:hypothetical protein